MGTSPIEPGVVLPGDYVLEAKLGDSNGQVYRARRSDGRVVVSRVFRPGLPLAAAAFLESAQTASRIRHPALASVEAYGRYGDEACFIISEYVQGKRLDEWADEVGIPPLPQIIELVRRLGLGLQAAARSGLTHDALNPHKIFVLKQTHGPGPRLPIKLIDLGVPGFLGSRAPRAAAVRFMSPEQLAALASEDRSIAFRCTGPMNVYSCGCLLYYLCTGGPPYPGANADELRSAQAAGRLAPPVRINPQISPAFNALILRALSLEPSERFANVAELVDALAHVSGSLHVHGKHSIAPPSVKSSPPPVVLTPLHDEDEPPTFKTARPPELHTAGPDALVVEVEADQLPTLPPAPLEGSANADGVGAPIGLFSSAPPWQEQRRSPTPPRPLTATGQRVTPLALFSEPDPVIRTPGEIIVAQAEPLASRLVGPYDASAARRTRRRNASGASRWVWSLASVACVVAYFVAQSVFSPTPAPIAAVLPAADSGNATRPAAPPVQRPAPAAAALEPVAERSAPPPIPQVPAAKQALVEAKTQVASAERSRERSHGRTTGHSARDSRNAAEENKPSAELPHVEPSVSAHTDETDAAAAHESEAHLAVVAPEKLAATESGAGKTKPGDKGSKAPDQVDRNLPAEPGLPLQAKVQVQAVAVRGSLPTSLVRRAVERIRPQLAACYASAARAAGRNAFGELSVEVEIDERGRARNPTARGGGLPHLNACVAEAASKLVSEKAPDTGTVSATWKVAFAP